MLHRHLNRYEPHQDRLPTNTDHEKRYLKENASVRTARGSSDGWLRVRRFAAERAKEEVAAVVNADVDAWTTVAETGTEAKCNEQGETLLFLGLFTFLFCCVLGFHAKSGCPCWCAWAAGASERGLVYVVWDYPPTWVTKSERWSGSGEEGGLPHLRLLSDPYQHFRSSFWSVDAAGSLSVSPRHPRAKDRALLRKASSWSVSLLAQRLLPAPDQPSSPDACFHDREWRGPTRGRIWPPRAPHRAWLARKDPTANADLSRTPGPRMC